jgi:hypothetical protein
VTVVQFAEWMPDQADLNGQGVGDILNVLCSTSSYMPFPDLAALSTALGAEPLGFIRARSLSGQVTIFAGTATKLWKLNNTTLVWDDVSKPATVYSANIDNRWCFEQFGEFVVAVDINDNPQYFELGVSTTFTDLPGSPPRAAFVRAWGDFLALLQLATNANRAHWSALNDITWMDAGHQQFRLPGFPRRRRHSRFVARNKPAYHPGARHLSGDLRSRFLDYLLVRQDPRRQGRQIALFDRIERRTYLLRR